MKTTVPLADLNRHLAGYSARLHPDVSNINRHVYFSNPMGQWITVRRRGQKAELDFTDDCPCIHGDT
jgi:hypothetical protein